MGGERDGMMEYNYDDLFADSESEDCSDEMEYNYDDLFGDSESEDCSDENSIPGIGMCHNVVPI